MNDEVDGLRQRAEDALRERSRKFSGLNVEELRQELNTYFIELEMQNQQLRETESQLQDAIARYQHLYHHAPIGYLTLDANGTIREVNETFADFCAMEAQQLRQTFFASLLVKESAAIFRQRLPAFFKRPEHKVLSLWLKGRRQKPIFLELRAEKTTYGDLLACNLIDRTEKELAQLELSRTSNRFRNIFNNIPVPYQTLNGQGEIVDVNPVWLQTLGYPPDEILGRRFAELLLPQSQELFAEDLRRLLREGRVDGVEYQIRHRDGRVFDILCSSRTEIDIEPDFQEIYFAFKDISLRKETECKYTTLINEARIGIALAEVNNGRIIECNQYLADLVERERHELLGQPQSILHPPEHERPDGRTHNFVSQSEKVSSLPLRQQCLSKTGKLIDVEVSSTRIQYQGRPMMLGIFQDISERVVAEEKRRQLEKQLQQKHKMEAIGVMAGGIAHNFNNSLAIILGNLELMEMLAPTGADMGQYLSNAKLALQRSRDLIRQIMIYTRDDRQDKAPLVLSELLRETFTLLRSTIPTTVDFTLMIPPAVEKLVVNAGANRLQEALINLCNNSVQAMNEKGELSMRLDAREISPEDVDGAAGRYAVIEVSDNGCGIPEDNLDKIFDPFFTTKDIGVGTGMGLSTVRGIIDNHGGFIRVQSRLGKGCSFSIFLPLTGENAGSEFEEQVIHKGTGNILFVDDEQPLVTTGRLLLSGLGYQVTGVTDPHQALELVGQDPRRFDLVISDQSMPGMTGTELARALNRIAPELPIILYTGYSYQLNEKTPAEPGVCAVGIKPMNLAEMSRMIELCLQRCKG